MEAGLEPFILRIQELSFLYEKFQIWGRNFIPTPKNSFLFVWEKGTKLNTTQWRQWRRINHLMESRMLSGRGLSGRHKQRFGPTFQGEGTLTSVRKRPEINRVRYSIWGWGSKQKSILICFDYVTSRGRKKTVCVT